MAYSELIKDINRIRAYLRNFYVYGLYTREEYAAMHLTSARSYDNERRRVESWMGDYLSFHRSSAGKKVFLSVDGNTIPENPLYRAFKAKSFTTNDVMLHFCVMDLFAGGDRLDQRQVEEQLMQRFGKAFFLAHTPDEKTIRLKLGDLTRLGVLVSDKTSRPVKYQLSPDQVDLNLPGLTDALYFFSEAAPVGVIGSFLQDKQEGDGDRAHCFRFRHHYLMHAIDSEILCELLTAIEENRKVRMRVDNPFQGPMVYETVPLKIYESTENGREYLLSWNDEQKRFFFSRTDRIIWISPLEEFEQRGQVMAQFEAQRKNLWGVSFGGLGSVGKAYHLEMEIRVGEKETFILHRLEREKRCGSIRQTGESRYLFMADVYDPVEMLPWICSYTGRIISLRSDQPQVVRKYEEYLNRLAGYYSVGADDGTGEHEETKADAMAVGHGDEYTGDGAAGRGVDYAADGAAGVRGADYAAGSAGHGKANAASASQEEAKSFAIGSGSGTKEGALREPGKGKYDLVFHEVYGAYYNAIAKILSLAVKGDLTKQKMRAIVREKGFGESLVYLPQRLMSGEWPLLTQQLGTSLKHTPAMPLTTIQKRWLKAVLEDSRIYLFLDDEEYARLRDGLRGIAPLYRQDSFCHFDRFLDGDPFADPGYISRFRCILRSIREGRALHVHYRNRYDKPQELCVWPEMIEYSAREDRFRLYAQQSGKAGWQDPFRLNLDRIISCEMLAEGDKQEDGKILQGGAVPVHGDGKIRQDSVVLELLDTENTLERAMLYFSYLEKKTERMDGGTFRVTLEYPKADETEILIRILSFGDQIRVISDGYIKQELARRVRLQSEHLEAEHLEA